MKGNPFRLLASSGPAEQATALRFFLVFAALAVGIVAAGFFYYRNIARQFRRDAEQQLAAIAELKVGELMQWRKERLGDGAIQQKNPAFTHLARRCLATPADADAQRQLQAWFLNFKTHLWYSRVALLDAQGTERLATPGPVEPGCSQVAASVAAVLQSGRVTFLDFHREAPDRPIHLSVLVPLLDEGDGHRPLGLLVMQIDPDRYLYPFIRRWPLPSETAETLLIRREGQEAVFLNELRFKANTALNLRMPFTQSDAPPVQAVQGKEGILEGRDYRGVPVLAAARAVPDSPWFLVARRDVADVFAPLRAQLWQVIVLVGGLIFSAGAGVGLVWREQRLRFLHARAKSAEALHQSEGAHRLLVQNLHAGVVVHAPDTTIKFANEQASTLLGLSAEQLLGKAAIDPDWCFLHEDETPLPLDEFPVNRVIATRQSLRDLVLGVCRPRTRDQVWVLVNAFPEYNDQNELRQVVVTFVDLTERKRADRMLRDNELKFRVLFEITNDAQLLFADGRWVDCNRAATRVFGCTREQILGASPSQFSPPTQPDGRPSAATVVELVNLAASGQPQVIEWEHCRLDGTSFTAEVCLNRLDLSGKPYIQSIVRDISERKRVETELQTEKANLDAIFESSPVALFILDEKTNIVRVNTAAVALTGGSQEATLHHRPGNALRCVHAAEEPRGCGYSPACPLCPVRNGIEALLAKGGTLRGAELRLELRRSGGTVPVWVSIDAATVQLDGRRHLCVAMEDITARKQAAAINAARLQLIDFAAVHSLDELLEETLNEAEKLSGSVIGFYHFVEADQVTLTLQNWSTRTKAVFCRAEGKGSHYGIDKAGVWVDCVRERKPVIHNDYASLPHRKGMPEGHAVVIRQLVVPVMQGGKVMAILGVGNKPSDYTEVDVDVVSQLAGLAWQIAVRKQAQTKVAEQLDELLRWQDAMEGREGRVLELKQEVNELLRRAGQPVRYSSAAEGGGGREQSSVSSEQSAVSSERSPVHGDQ